MYNYQKNNSNNGIFNGFLGPFVLGGITGGLIAPYFYRQPYYYYPYPYYYQFRR